MSQIISHQASRIVGEYTPPGDKSISHRLVILGALASGKSEFSHFLEADDCLRTIEAFRSMGVQFQRSAEKIAVNGVGLKGLSSPKSELDLGNSGTTMRLLLGVLAGQPFEAHLTGDVSLSKRPMRRVTQPLRKMGARITGRDDAGFAPLVIQGGQLSGIRWMSEVPSAQVKSAILLAGLYAEGETSIEEVLLSRDHTERLLLRFGASLKRSGRTVSIQKTERLQPTQFDVPGDISSAAFFITAAAFLQGSDLWVRRVNLNSTRTGIIEILESMGADISIHIQEDQDEPVGDIHVKGSSLAGVTIEKHLIPSLIDELPILMVACALAEGVSIIRGAQELRVKETDRIRSMALGLRAIGARVEEREDGCVIEGVREFVGGTVSSVGDHRTAMSLVVAALRSKAGVVIQDTDCIGTSYPNFEADLKQLVVS